MEPYVLKRGSFKNLTLRLRPSDGSLRVSAPWFVPRIVVDRFVAERAGWIAEQRRLLADRRPEIPSLSQRFVWGVSHRVLVESPGKLPRVLWNPEQRELVLRVPSSWTDDQKRRVLERWEKEQVERTLERLVPEWADRMKLSVAGWTVKRLRSRWGSCQPSTHRLVFNAHLAALPPRCLEHVVVHELVHLVERSHSARFHALVEHWLPGSKEVRALLRKGIGPGADDDAPEPPSTREAEREP